MSDTKESETNRNNIWNHKDFKHAGVGEKIHIVGTIKHFFRCMRWSMQRIIRGYAECDVWSMYSFLQKLIPDMLQTLKNTRHGSPAFLGKNYTNEEGVIVNDTCHEEWDRILEQMIFLWREIDEENCSKQNNEERELEQYRNKCKNEAMDLLKEYFFSLWD